MLSRAEQPQSFSNDKIRQFLLGQLRARERIAFEHALFCNSSVEQRMRLEEIALADDYATGRLRENDLKAFMQTFRFTTARRSQIEVSMALRECFASPAEAAHAGALPTFKHPLWRWAFAAMILIMLFATLWVATKEPRIVRRLLPHRTHPATAPTLSPEAAHHAERASEPVTHHDQQVPPPGHELSSDMVFLDATTTAENAPTVTLATIQDKRLHTQLRVGEAGQSSYVAELITKTGEVVYRDVEMPIDANPDRVSFDIPIENLAAGDFQIKLTRTADGKRAIYFLRLK